MIHSFATSCLICSTFTISTRAGKSWNTLTQIWEAFCFVPIARVDHASCNAYLCSATSFSTVIMISTEIKYSLFLSNFFLSLQTTGNNGRTAKLLNNWSISRHLTQIIKFSLLKTTKQKGLWKPLAKSSIKMVFCGFGSNWDNLWSIIYCLYLHTLRKYSF